MTNEEKQFLLKDLCARLPYGVKCHFKYGTSEDDIILKCIDDNVARFDYGWYGKFHVIIDHQYIKPYLRPMSSMTEEEHNDWFQYYQNAEMEELNKSGDYFKAAISGDNAKYDWLNANYFDYRGLIPMGLAIEAPEGMYN